MNEPPSVLNVVLFKFLMLMILFAPLVYAEDFEIEAVKISKNFFKLFEKPILIQTRNCDEMAQHQGPFLKIDTDSKIIRFRQAEEKCEVKAAYKRSVEGMGSYAVTVTREEEDWYAVLDTASYIKTKGCDRLAQNRQAVLSLSGTGFGSLHIEHSECLVEGIYTKIE